MITWKHLIIIRFIVIRDFHDNIFIYMKYGVYSDLIIWLSLFPIFSLHYMSVKLYQIFKVVNITSWILSVSVQRDERGNINQTNQSASLLMSLQYQTLISSYNTIFLTYFQNFFIQKIIGVLALFKRECKPLQGLSFFFLGVLIFHYKERVFRFLHCSF